MVHASEKVATVAVENGRVVCIGQCLDFVEGSVDVINLKGGVITLQPYGGHS